MLNDVIKENIVLFFRKKSVKSAKDDKHADADEVDPGTLVAADDVEGGVAGLLQDNNNSAKKTKGKKGKKKGKKKKMTKSEKDLVYMIFLKFLLLKVLA